ncbi:flagellar basal body rod protein FlgG [Kurthia sp. 3B1D]|uniref:Flagellar basal body rod protein FlgG n=2 Tax=Kurthia TaxID=1649 RepID=A0A433RT64_9BACL|nr:MULTISPECIES: flagellar basal body rod protein FlgG [unclassified Kurthia]RUS55343.1 flagellar basal body rod protein FlgG [Kurthia sp. 3B1D]
MLRSMYSGVSGLRNFQTKLDVIGNNIANVNTYGFKKGRTTFKDLISQTSAGAGGATDTMGGTNPKQIGLGSAVASIDTIADQSSLQTTNRVLDLAIEGDGYFEVTKNGETMYTRSGNFYLDSNGALVTSDGAYIQAAGSGNINIPAEATEVSISQDGTVNAIVGGQLTPLGQIGVTKFINPGGLTKVGANFFKPSANSGAPSEEKTPGVEGNGVIQSGFLEMSNVDMSEEFTEMIIAQRAFQANSRIITTSDEILQELVNLKR